MKKFLYIISLIFSILNYSQKGIETEPPFNIKTISFSVNNNNVIPFFKIGETFELSFDDLYGDEADYYYTITQYNYDWSSPSDLAKVEYLNGNDNQRIITYENSFNTLQIYSHYKQVFPNRFNQITKSGNYLITIFNDEREIVFSRKFVIYEEQVNVGLLVRRARDFDSLDGKQNIEMSINYGDRILQNPIQNVKVTLFQNGNWKTSISNIKPQYTLGSELIYRYNKETQFWGGNEAYSIDNKIIRGTNNTVAKVTSGENIYNTYLYVNTPRRNQPYTYFPDINGNFAIQNINTNNPQIEADYSWVYFALNTPNMLDKNIYIVGMFNNYNLSEEYKMEFNKNSGFYEKAILLKQGFTNYQYVVTDKNGKVDNQNTIDGNHFQTENNYTAIVYYRGNNDRYDRVIGIANTNSEVIRN
ncbi:type IX secretion system plug protein [Flavobacterium sp.]|uniref:type IX secretion system plug protein n=2 Tax=Flavobacterium sp. TaxID=239 RepID=UPI0040476DC9